MNENKLKEIKALETLLKHLIKPNMTVDEKIKVLSNSYWASHNVGYGDYIAGKLMAGIEDCQTERYDLDCKYKWEAERLCDLLNELKAENGKEG